MMMTLRRISQAALLAAGLALQTAAASAQDPSVAVRLSSMEEQMRQLFGQIEQLNMKVEQITAELQEMRSADSARAKPGKAAAASVGTQPDTGAEELTAQPPPPGGAAENDDLYAYQTGELDKESGAEVIAGGLEQAPGPKPLGTLPDNSAAGRRRPANSPMSASPSFRKRWKRPRSNPLHRWPKRQKSFTSFPMRACCAGAMARRKPGSEASSKKIQA